MNTQKFPAQEEWTALRQDQSRDAAGRIWPLRMRPSPISDHPVADIAVKTQRQRTTRPPVGAPGTAARPVTSEIVGTGARVPGPLIAGDPFLAAPNVSEAAE
jgi:hypothetical protein